LGNGRSRRQRLQQFQQLASLRRREEALDSIERTPDILDAAATGA
jgi:hypothetical protein